MVLLPRKQRFFLEYRTRHSFSDLPVYIKQRIFKFLFSYTDKLIHAISRLDQFVEPAEIPLVGGRRSGLLNRFHITGKYSGHGCSLTYAIKGNDLLAPLLVSRQFLFLGAHAFYGGNTFAFSSVSSASSLTNPVVLLLMLMDRSVNSAGSAQASALRGGSASNTSSFFGSVVRQSRWKATHTGRGDWRTSATWHA